MRLRKLVSDVCARAEQGRLIVFSHFGHLGKFERMRFGRKQLVATTAVQHTQRIREEEDVVEEIDPFSDINAEVIRKLKV